ncbi:MAG: hypothetical protein MSG78_00940 [Clostridiales bacterium]|nr:hypothetical protein [Clostridiales bacterium]
MAAYAVVVEARSSVTCCRVVHLDDLHDGHSCLEKVHLLSEKNCWYLWKDALVLNKMKVLPFLKSPFIK